MKIVLVGQYYWPDNFLINEIAEEMVARGHKVTVLTGLPDYATNHVPKEYKHGKNRHEIRNGVEIYRVPIIARHTGFIFRVLNYISFFITSSIFARFHKFDADVIMAYQTAPVLMGNAAIVLKRKYKKPLFFYCLDIWPDQMKVWGVYEKNSAYKIVRRYCKYAYGSADLLGISSLPFKEYMIDINKVDDNKIVYLPQHSARMNVKKLEEKKDHIDLIFAGNIGEQQNVECLIKAVSKIKTTKKYKVHIYGNGSSYDKCKKLAEKLNVLDNIIFYGRVPKSDLNKIYPRMDAFLLTLCSEKEIGFVANTVPAKFQGYISAGKPVIASIDGGAKKIIEDTKCGLVVSANDVNGFATIIKEFIENPDKYTECGVRGKKYFDENYDKNIVINKLEGYLKDLISNGK
ncbi:MAG: glycosyltransferase family 4 protein [Lachnospira sp.]|nr:glycosyltransferase family 4 protein [Lachnospira sp.]